MHYDEQAEEWEARQRKGIQAPAPAWTREAPKEPGLFWCRPHRDSPLWKSWREPEKPVIGEVFRYFEGSTLPLRVWFHGSLCEEALESLEWWPVRLEPPK